jgi:hypothetical protein
MPDRSKRCRQHQHDERQGDNDTPDFCLVRHSLEAPQRIAATQKLV